MGNVQNHDYFLWLSFKNWFRIVIIIDFDHCLYGLIFVDNNRFFYILYTVDYCGISSTTVDTKKNSEKIYMVDYYEVLLTGYFLPVYYIIVCRLFLPVYKPFSYRLFPPGLLYHCLPVISSRPYVISYLLM